MKRSDRYRLVLSKEACDSLKRNLAHWDTPIQHVACQMEPHDGYLAGIPFFIDLTLDGVHFNLYWFRDEDLFESGKMRDEIKGLFDRIALTPMHGWQWCWKVIVSPERFDELAIAFKDKSVYDAVTGETVPHHCPPLFTTAEWWKGQLWTDEEMRYIRAFRQNTNPSYTNTGSIMNPWKKNRELKMQLDLERDTVARSKNEYARIYRELDEWKRVSSCDIADPLTGSYRIPTPDALRRHILELKRAADVALAENDVLKSRLNANSDEEYQQWLREKKARELEDSLKTYLVTYKQSHMVQDHVKAHDVELASSLSVYHFYRDYPDGRRENVARIDAASVLNIYTQERGG